MVYDFSLMVYCFSLIVYHFPLMVYDFSMAFYQFSLQVTFLPEGMIFHCRCFSPPDPATNFFPLTNHSSAGDNHGLSDAAGSGVQPQTGAWHWLPFPQRGRSDFLIIYKDGTRDSDLEIVPLREWKAIEAARLISLPLSINNCIFPDCGIK
ncbi:MAG: hypothetical protein ACM3X9_01740 [Bacillota bacterium]